MRRSGLVPRIIPTIGLVGAPLLFLSTTITMFGGWEQTSSVAMLFAFPIATWEFAVGAYMAVKGFKASPVIDLSDESPAVLVAAA